MSAFNVHEAKTHFSRLLARAEAGEEVVISRAGKPVAKLVPVENGRPRAKPGLGKGTIKFKGDMTDPLPEAELNLWYHGDIFPPDKK